MDKGDRRQREVVPDLRDVREADEFLEIVEAFAGCFDPDDLAGVLDIVRALPERSSLGRWSQLDAIAHLAGQLHTAGMDEPIDAIVSQALEHERGLHMLVPKLPDSWRARFLEQILAKYPTTMTRIAASLLPHLAPSEKETLLRGCDKASFLGNDLLAATRRGASAGSAPYGDRDSRIR